MTFKTICRPWRVEPAPRSARTCPRFQQRRELTQNVGPSEPSVPATPTLIWLLRQVCCQPEPIPDPTRRRRARGALSGRARCGAICVPVAREHMPGAWGDVCRSCPSPPWLPLPLGPTALLLIQRREAQQLAAAQSFHTGGDNCHHADLGSVRSKSACFQTESSCHLPGR